MTEKNQRRAEIVIGLWFLLAIVASAVFTADFAIKPDCQIEGLSLGVAFSSIAAALIVWSRDLVGHDTVEDPRHPQRSSDEERESAIWLAEGVTKRVMSRTWLVRLGIAAATALGIAALFPLRTLGQSPKGRVGLTDWKRGVRLVREDGTPVRTDDVEYGSVVTAFPEGHTGSDYTRDMAVDAVIVMRVQQNQLQLPSDAKTGAPEGFIAYSKICTHLGCPLGLYRAGDQQLVCPCHQSTFNVLDGGKVVFGPAARSLPMLPLQLASDGTLAAADYMNDYVGPDNWNYGEKWDKPQTRIGG